ncbi:MAG: SLBB domain-containing protein [Candidatus Zhuqueibacterota bacterium]
MRIKKGILFLILLVSGVTLYGQERRIKPGDVIEIIVADNVALSQSVVVRSNGTVEYPTLQDLPVDGITLNRFQELLITQLSRFLETSPLVLVRFGESYPIRVTVLGQVVMPGLYTIANTATLQGAIGAAGGLTPGAQLSKVKLIRDNSGSKENIIINMENFYKNGDPSALPLLKEGDTIVIPGNPLATNVKVLGCVENPGSYDVLFQTTILDVIFMAGGPTEDANLKKVKIISLTGQDARDVKIDIDELMHSKTYINIPIVVPGDVVYIPKKKLNWSGIMTVIRDLTAFATLYYIIYRSSGS